MSGKKSFAEVEKRPSPNNSVANFAKSDSFKTVLAESDDPHPEILADAIKLGEVLGKGSFGTVHQATLLGTTVAVKVLDSESGLDLEDQEFLKKFKHEISIMAKAHHPNIMLYMGACTSVPGKLMIVTEKLKIDLETLLIKEGPNRSTDISLERRLGYAKDVAVAMAFLHSRDPAFLHLDLKPANILLDHHETIKVADFGQTLQKSRNQTHAEEYQGGTPYYMSPELLEGGNINEKADVYSFAICLYEIVYQKKAFNYTGKLIRYIQDVVENDVRPVLEDQALTRKVTPRLQALKQRCWDKDPKKRPLFPEVIKELTEILGEYYIQEEKARLWWKQNFFDEFTQNVSEEVTWSTFAKAFEKLVTGKNPAEKTLGLEAVKAILAQSLHQEFKKTDEKYVTMDYFGKVVGWFGPLDVLVDQIKAALSYEYFHGDLSNDAAYEQVRIKPVGTFLLRLSQSVLGAFNISLVRQTQSGAPEMVNRRFMYNAETRKFVFQQKEFSTLSDLISANKEKLGLIAGVPCTTFSHVFRAVQTRNSRFYDEDNE